MKQLISFLTKLFTVVFGIFSVAIILITLFRPEWMKIAIEWIGNLLHTWGNWNYVIAFASACLESFPIIGTIIPGMNIMILV